MRESGKRKRLTYRDQEPRDPAQHELWRFENVLEDGKLVDLADQGLFFQTAAEAEALGMIHGYLKKMCGRRVVCKGCPGIKRSCIPDMETAPSMPSDSCPAKVGAKMNSGNVYFAEKNVRGVWAVYGALGVKQYYGYTKKEALKRYNRRLQ